MLKRVLDVVVASGGLILGAPLMLFAAVGIRLTSPGPIFYRAARIARDRRKGHEAPAATASERRRGEGYYGREFTMYKFRTMHVMPGDGGAPITAHNDSRIFRFGAFLRASKIDEIPQLINVLKGEMALVGPRPEAPSIVRSYYKSDDLTTLQVAPGVTSPGTIYYYTHCESMLGTDAVIDEYVERLLPVKLALDRVYLKHATVLYDVRLLIRTIAGIAARLLGNRNFPDPPELAEAGVNRRITRGPS